MSALKWSKVSENNWLCHFKRDNPLIPPRPTKFYCPRRQTSPKPRKLLPYSCLKSKRSFYKNISISWEHNTSVWRLWVCVSWTQRYNSGPTFPSYFTCQHLRVITCNCSLNPRTINSWPIRGCYSLWEADETMKLISCLQPISIYQAGRRLRPTDLIIFETLYF